MTMILTIFAASLLALAVLLTGFQMLRSRIQWIAAQALEQQRTIHSLSTELEAQALLVRQMSLDLEETRKYLENRGQPTATHEPKWSDQSIPVNLNRRGQILRLTQKGKSAAEIATDLHISQGEVELLLKVHDLTRSEN